MFEVGEKVVCINNSGDSKELILHEIYEIFEIVPDPSGVISFVLIGFDPFDAYYHWRFRKLDNSFAEDLLEKISQEVKQEELLTV